MTAALSPFETPGAAPAAQALARPDAEALCFRKSGGRLGVALMGGVLVTLNSHLRRDDLGYVLRQSDSRGLFGLPSVTVGGKIFFGNDRLDLLERHLGRLRGYTKGP
jgi:hypothetical protein